MRERAEWIIYNYPQLFVEEGDSVPSTTEEKEALVAQITGADDYNYFEIVSEHQLGIKQTAQFQSGDTGYDWRWKRDCESTDVCIDMSISGIRADEMPRTNYYGYPYGTYFNSYAASAESLTYEINSGNYADSVCPRGWQIPLLFNSDTSNKSWRGILAGTYSEENDYSITLATTLRRSPVSVILSGYFSNQGHMVSQGSAAYILSSSIESSKTRRVAIGNDGVNIGTGSDKTTGEPIRCVKRD